MKAHASMAVGPTQQRRTTANHGAAYCSSYSLRAFGGAFLSHGSSKASRGRRHRDPVRSSAEVEVSSLGAGSTEEEVGDHGHKGYAILHDFCMTIPFGAAVLVGGAITALSGATAPGLILIGCGAVLEWAATLSLRLWKKGESSTPATIIATLMAGYVAYVMRIKVKMLSAQLPTWKLLIRPATILLCLSTAATLFYVYNMVAGGNAPRRGTH